MIDNQDKQTQPLDLGPAPKRRGRPAKENALSNAERQRLYRERQKAQRNGKQIPQAAAEAALITAIERADDLASKLGRANDRIKELETQLAQRNEKTSTKSAPGEGIWTPRFKVKGSRTWVNCDPQVDFEGVPWSYENTKKHVQEMQAMQKSITWQAVRDDGLIYDPKAAK